MGLLDSNSVGLKQKSDSFIINLNQTGNQNTINFGSNGYQLLCFEVAGLSNEDILIAVNGCIVSNYSSLNIKDADGNVYSSISDNGRYYVNVVGLTSIAWIVTRRAEGSATVRWSLSVYDNVEKKIDTLISYLSHPNLINGNKITYDLSSVANKATYNNVDNCRCLAINVETITAGAEMYLIDNKNRVLLLLNSMGDIVQCINSADIYYTLTPIAIPSVTLRCTKAVDNGTTEVRVCWMPEFPDNIAAQKPIQCLKTINASIESASQFMILNYTDSSNNLLRFFKYWFVSYSIKNNGTSVNRTVHLIMQPYHKYQSYTTGKAKEFFVGTNYSEQSDWQENQGLAMRLYVKVDDYQEGDTIDLNLYGVR